MMRQTINKSIATLILASLGAFSLSAIAGQDETQRQIVQQAIKAKQKLKEAEAAKALERQRLMGDHLKMMKETLGEMRKLKPTDGMTAQEHEAWIETHQSLMEEMMSQMMEEHHMMMGMGKMPAGMDDMHQH
jgi:predicted DNA-binding protein YlxM (UPF0122 family)